MASLAAWIYKMIFGQTHCPEVGEEIVQAEGVQPEEVQPEVVQPEVGQKRRREEEEDDMETSKKFRQEAEQPSWPAICRRFGITEEQEKAFTRGLALSRADTIYFAGTHMAKMLKRVELFGRRHVLEQALAVFDAAMPARLADCVGSDQDVAGAARSLAWQRLAMADRAAACSAEFKDVPHAADNDWQLWCRALAARDEMSAYYRGARARYMFEDLIDRTSAHNSVAQMYDRARIASLSSFPDMQTLPGYAGPTLDDRRRHGAAHDPTV